MNDTCAEEVYATKKTLVIFAYFRDSFKIYRICADSTYLDESCSSELIDDFEEIYFSYHITWY